MRSGKVSRFFDGAATKYERLKIESVGQHGLPFSLPLVITSCLFFQQKAFHVFSFDFRPRSLE